MSIVFMTITTIIVYISARTLSFRLPSPLTTPVFTSTVALIVLFSLSGVTVEDYEPAKNALTFLLGPATVALAVPLYRNRTVLMERLVPAAAGLVIGTVATILSAVFLATIFGFSEELTAAAAVKAVTTPVAIEAAVILGGDPALSAAFVITAGIFGAMFGPLLLKLMRIDDPFSKGLGIGTVSHGIGTSRAVMESPLEGAVSSAAMGFAAMITSVLLPWLKVFL